jgi:Spy/CpxP family protein refolding chaperone
LTEIPTASPSSTRTTAVVVVIVAFIAGLFAGAAGDRFYLFRTHRLFPGRHMMDFAAHRIVDRLDRELHLTPQQKTQVQQIIDRHRVRIDAVMSGVRPQVRQELDATNAEIEKILTPDQRTQFGKMRMRMPGRRGMGPPPPPPPQ